MNGLKYLLGMVIGFFCGLWFANGPATDKFVLQCEHRWSESNTLPSSANGHRAAAEVTPDLGAVETFRQALQSGDYQLAVQLIADAERVDSVLSQQLRNELYGQLEWLANAAEYPMALELADAWLAVFYGDTRVLTAVARMHWRHGEYARAISVIDTFRLQGYDDSRATWRTQLQYMLDHAEQDLGAAGDDAGLRRVYQELAARGLTDAALQFRLAELYALSGDSDNARAELDAVLEDPSWYASGRALLARLERKQGADVRVELTARAGQFFIDLHLSSYTRARLLLDTGASVSALSEAAFRELRTGATFVPLGDMMLATAGGQVRAPAYRLAQLTLGDQVLSDVDFAILAEDFEGFDGVLGMNALGQVNFEIDQAGAELLVKGLR